MSEHSAAPTPEHLSTIYVQGSEWVRMVNTIVWTAGTILVASAFAGLAYGVEHRGQRLIAMAASLIAYTLWLYITHLYNRTARIARDTLRAIEEQWQLQAQVMLFSRQTGVGSGKFGLMVAQYCGLILLVVAWTALITLG